MGPEGGPAPLILALTLDGASFAYLDGLRRRHFPPERNIVPAHLTLFHSLPGSERRTVEADLGAACRTRRPFDLQATGPRSLGRGVAIAFSSPELVSLRNDLAREWRDWLTPQDSARIAPHVTVQNKVAPDAARALLADLAAGFAPFSARAEGVTLWEYRGGPWAAPKRFRFGA